MKNGNFFFPVSIEYISGIRLSIKYVELPLLPNKSLIIIVAEPLGNQGTRRPPGLSSLYPLCYKTPIFSFTSLIVA